MTAAPPGGDPNRGSLGQAPGLPIYIRVAKSTGNRGC
jgi:hypothetical protein